MGAVKQSAGEKAFSMSNYILLAALGLLAVVPFIHVVAQSFSSHRAIMSGEVFLLPIEFQLNAYMEVFKDKAFTNSFLMSVLRTAVGTSINVLLTIMLAYPLAKPYIRGRSFISFLVVFTMLFSGGMIPTYLVVKEVGLLNSFWAYIIPGAIWSFNVILMRSFFQSIPIELEESARMDGCSNVGILIRIIVPLSMPAIATITLFHAVGHWNAFFDAVLYVTDRKLYPLQVYLRELIQFNQSNMKTNDNWEQQMIATESLKAAALFTGTLPILIVYPFLQKHFVKGIMLGSVKG
jgi:putative aldouronate transport system permease protein